MTRGLVIEAADVAEVAGEMATPAVSATGRWTERRGLWLRIRAEDGTVGEGEASPLPDYSVDDLDGARAALETMPWDRIGALDPGRDPLPQVRRALQLVKGRAPSARFAVETALLDLLGRRRGVPVHRLLGGVPVEPLPLCQLLDGADDRRLRRSADRAVQSGFRTVKMKIGRDPDGDVQRVATVRSIVGPETRLRLDANRGLSADQLADRLRELAASGPELLEEPASFSVVSRLALSPVPLAVDETLHDPDMRERVRAATRAGRYVTWVLKPMALGGVLACLELAREARAAGADVIVSHLFDGPIAHAAAAELALSLGPGRAVGLGRHAGFAVWPERPSPSVRSTSLVPHGRPGLGLGDPP